MQHLLAFIFAVLLSAIPAESAVLTLSSGGEVEGELQNAAEIEPDCCEIKTAAGIVLRIKSGDIAKVQKTSGGALPQYQAEAPFAENTVEKHLYWGEWCTNHQLPDHAKQHWQRVLDLDSENIVARSSLGFVKTASGWENLRERMESRGLIKHEGRWKTPQQIEMESQLKELTKSQIQQKRQIAAWIKKLPDASAEKALLAIDDSAAVPPLMQNLRDEKNVAKRLVLFRALLPLDKTAAACWAMEEPANDTRQSCIDLLLEQLKDLPEQRRAVQNVCRGYVHRRECLAPAAHVLAELECYDAVPALIEALVITKEIVREEKAPTTMGGGGMNFSYGARTVKETKSDKNAAVLAALQKLTGQNFAFDQKEWRDWEHRSRIVPTANLRRE